jgi:hypothetical protein
MMAVKTAFAVPLLFLVWGDCSVRVVARRARQKPTAGLITPTLQELSNLPNGFWFARRIGLLYVFGKYGPNVAEQVSWTEVPRVSTILQYPLTLV